MPILSVSISKLEAERTGTAPRVEVKLQPEIVSVETSKLEGIAKKPQDVLNVGFSFNVKFNPEVGRLRLEGNVLYLDSSVNKIYSEWQKSKKLPDGVHTEVMNAVFRNVIPKAMFVSNELQLPPILPIPRVVRRQQKK